MARKRPEFHMSSEQQKLAASNLNLARREAWRYQRRTGIEYHILESVAFEGLCKAAYRYDPSLPHPETGKPMKFSSLAVPTIKGEILHWIRDKTYAVRLPHKMREQWVKGRKLLYRGSTDMEIAHTLEISLTTWLEVRKICSGPPLELNEQAKPTDSLEPNEVNFGETYLKAAAWTIERLGETLPQSINQLEVYIAGNASKIPRESVDKLLANAGCDPTDWSEIEIDLLEGWEDMGNGRQQGCLF